MKKKTEEPINDLVKEENKMSEIKLSENEILQLRLLNTQNALLNTQENLINKNIESLNDKKELLKFDKKQIIESYEEIKKELEKRYLINFNDYNIDFNLNVLKRK